jgi:hypothetical protein
MLGAFLVGHSRDSERVFYGMLGEISYGIFLSKWVWINRIQVRSRECLVSPSLQAKMRPNRLE